MALSVGHVEGAFARVSAEIGGRTAVDNQDRRIARRALYRADELLGDLEELQLRGLMDLPSWLKESATAVRWASIEAGIRDQHLDTESVIKLMDGVYTLEERLMRRLRLRTVHVVSRRF